MTDKEKMESKVEDKGNNKLIVLGIISIAIAIVTSLISLYVYHQSGDIYLDRSRPGFLPDVGEEEKEKEQEIEYTFSESGSITKKTLEEYIENFKKTSELIKKLGVPYEEDPISDKTLGI